MASITVSGSFKKTEKFLKATQEATFFNRLDALGRRGVDLLSSATPVDSNLTASSWEYKRYKTKKGLCLAWHNTNVESGVPVAVLIQYGHATGTGGYVQGIDFINPVIRPLFDQIAQEVWEGVKYA